MVIYVLNFSLKKQFWNFPGEKTKDFPRDAFLSLLYMIVYLSAAILRNLSCPKKFLVTLLLWKYSQTKMLCNTFDEEKLKIIIKWLDSVAEINMISLQCSWIRKIYKDNYHEWKIMPFSLINKHLDNILIFIKVSLWMLKTSNIFASSMQKFHQLAKYFTCSYDLSSCVLSKILW